MMARKQAFFFTNNALSKAMLLKVVGRLLLARGKSMAQRVRGIISDFFGIEPSRLYLFAAGRMGVYTLLKSLDMRPDEHVIVAGYTCVVLSNAVKFAGCQIRYVDVRKDDFNIDTDKLLQVIDSNSRVLIAPHNFGIPYGDIDLIKSRYPELIVIEDVAHSFGSRDANGRLCGRLGDASFFSLEYSKPITSGLGGILLINNPELQAAFRKRYEALPYFPLSTSLKILLSLLALNLTYTRKSDFFQRAASRLLRSLGLQYGTSQGEIDGRKPEHYPAKLRHFLAAILLPQMEEIEPINQRRKRLVESYAEAFSAYRDIEPLSQKGEVMVRYPILFKEHVQKAQVDAIKREAADAGLRLGEWFNDVVHPSGSYRYGYEAGSCPVGEFIASRIINLSVNAHYPPRDSDINELKQIFEKHGIS